MKSTMTTVPRNNGGSRRRSPLMSAPSTWSWPPKYSARPARSPGEHRRELDLGRQGEFLHNPTDLVEVGLLRGGVDSGAVEFDRLSARVGPFDPQVAVHRADRFGGSLAVPARLDERLPEITIPSLRGDPDVFAGLDGASVTRPNRHRIRCAEASSVPSLSRGPLQTSRAAVKTRRQEPGDALMRPRPSSPEHQSTDGLPGRRRCGRSARTPARMTAGHASTFEPRARHVLRRRSPRESALGACARTEIPPVRIGCDEGRSVR